MVGILGGLFTVTTASSPSAGGLGHSRVAVGKKDHRPWSDSARLGSGLGVGILRAVDGRSSGREHVTIRFK
jgi:hypothetical protein